MDKKRLFKIMARATSKEVEKLSEKIKKNRNNNIVIIKEPGKTLTMIKMREPVKNSLFYLGEVIVSEAVVELNKTKGIGVVMGDDFDKALNMAIIDAAVNKGIFEDIDILNVWEEKQQQKEEKENAMHLKTMVSFSSMHTEASNEKDT